MSLDFRTLAIAGLHLLWVAAAQAQATAPVADKAAMERAQREADGPKRRILEAARLRVATRVTETTSPAATVTTSATTASKPHPDGVETEASLATLPSSVLPLPVTPELSAMVATISPLPVVELQSAEVRLVSMPAPPPVALNLPPAVLLSKVEPEWPGRLFRSGARRTEVVMELTLRTDGTVADAVVRQSPSPDLEAPALAAVRQWRYEPQPVTRRQVVRLVVSPG